MVDNDKCIGCQMCYSDDLTKVQQHKEEQTMQAMREGRWDRSFIDALEARAIN